MITVDSLREIVGCSQERAELFHGHLADAAGHYGITSAARLAAFLAQIGHESGSFRYVRELASGEAYEGRKDLGNTVPGDGARYRGRGLIQTTGRANYARVRDRLRAGLGPGVPDFEAEPDALEHPKWAAWSAADYWDMRGLNAYADRGDFEGITRRINGGLNGQADRLKRWEKAKAVLALLGDEAAAPAEPITYTPAGEAGPQEATMAPFLTAVLPHIVGAVPKLIETFGSGSEVSQRNQKAAEMVAAIAKDALGAVNEQDVAEKLKSDPSARETVRKAVEAQWFAIQEAGGGGITGARQFVASQNNPAVWKIVGVVTYAALAFLLLANLIAIGAWGVAMWRSSGVESATQILVQVIAADILSATSAISFWLGSSFGSRQKDEAKA